MKNTVGAIFVAWTLVSCSPEQQIVEAPAEAPRMKMTTEIPGSITTPDSVETRIGRLEFSDGAPSVATAMAVYDNLDFQRGVRTFLDAMPIASLYGMREGLREVGMVNGTVGII